MTTNIMDDKFNDKYKSLSEEVKFFLSSELSGRIILDLAKEYKIEEEKVYSLVFVIVNSEFDFRLLEEKIKNLNLSGISLAKFRQDFIGRFLLPIASFIEESSKGKINILNELKKTNAKPETYQSFVDDLEDEFEDEVLKIIEEEADNYRNSFDVKEESNFIFDLFNAELISVLKVNNFKAASGLNRSLIYLLFNADNFKEDLLRKIFNNKELIGDEKIKIDEKELAPTISAWLKDFIKKNGSSLFDDIVLAQYLNTSENVKDLKSKDKELLSSLVRLYKNVAFFPESMSDLPPQKWQIFPFDDSEYWKEFDSLTKSSKKPSESELEKGFSNFSDDDVLSERVIGEDRIEKKTYADESNNAINENKVSEVKSSEEENRQADPELQNLQELLASFPPASLERKAIAEEIRRLKR